MLTFILFILSFCPTFGHRTLLSDGLTLDLSLPPPRLLELREREFEAIVEFSPNFNEPNGLDQFDDRVISYLVEWGPVGQNFPDIIRQVRPNGQMQVLEGSGSENTVFNELGGAVVNVIFEGQIVNIALGADGVSLVRSDFLRFFFRSNSVAVDLIRSQSNDVFFDDFNGAPGDYDERRWNIAFEVCGLERTANFNVNGQDHVHTQLGALNDDCPAESLSARARAIIDFGGGAGATIYNDVDGGDFPGQLAFVEIFEEQRDMPFFGLPIAARTEGIRIGVDNSQLFVEQILANGQPIIVPGSQVNLFALGVNVYTIANIRRPWTYLIRRDRITVTINGRPILNNLAFLVPLSFSRGHVYFTHENRNSGINGMHAVTQHLDNIGFNAGGGNLPDATQQFNYRNVVFKGFQDSSAGAFFTVDVIEDDAATFSNAIQRVTVFFTVQGEFDFSLPFSLNGVNIIAEPQGGVNPRSVAELVTVQLELNGAGIVLAGQNFFFSPPGNFFVGNFHVEFDLKCAGSELAEFTPPNSQPVFPSNGFPISFECDDELLARPTMFFDPNTVVFRTVGVNIEATITVDVEGSRQLRHNGAGLGIDRIEVLLDCTVDEVQTIDLGGQAFQIADLDITVRLPNVQNSEQELWIRSVDTTNVGNLNGNQVFLQTAGRSSTFHPTRFDANLVGQGRTLDYLPLIVSNVNGFISVRLSNLNERDATCNPNPARNEAFIGGNCPAGVDDPVYTEGRIGAPICPDHRGVEPFSRGARAPPRSTLLGEMERTFTGWTGDWHENQTGVCEVELADSQGCNMNCLNTEGDVEACLEVQNRNVTKTSWRPYIRFQEDIDAFENGEVVRTHWLDRDLTEGYAVFEDAFLSAAVSDAFLNLPEEVTEPEDVTDESGGLSPGIVALIVCLCVAAAIWIGFMVKQKQASSSYQEVSSQPDGTYAPPLAA